MQKGSAETQAGTCVSRWVDVSKLSKGGKEGRLVVGELRHRTRKRAGRGRLEPGLKPWIINLKQRYTRPTYITGRFPPYVNTREHSTRYS